MVDTFTGSSGSLSGHNPDTGNAASWLKLTGTGAQDLVLSTNQLASNDVTGVSLIYLNSTPPMTADYAVALDVFFTGTNAATTLRLFGRFSGTSAADLNGYVLEFNPTGTNNLMVKTVTNGTFSAAQCVVSQPIQAGANRVTLLVAGNSITAKGPTQSCNWVDAGNLFTAAGAPGIGMASNTANNVGVWDSNYVAVYHLSEVPTTTVFDSTSNANNLTSAFSLVAADRVAAKISFGTRFDASTNTEHLVTTSTVTLQSFTMEAFVNTTFAPGTGVVHLIADVSSDRTTHRGLNLDTTDALSVALNTTTGYPVSSSGVSFQSAWHHVAARFGSGANLLNGFIDGTLQAQTQAPGFASITGRLSVGNWLLANWNTKMILRGIADEVRISSIPRSDCWIQTGQASMSAPSSFIALGAEGAAPTAIRLVSFGATDRGKKGVQVQWRTGYEVDNLGFHVYRETGGARVRITPSLVAGSALFAGRKLLTAGRSYTWWDRSPVAGSVYVLEEWDLKGARRLYGPVASRHGTGLGASVMEASSALLSGLGTRAEGSASRLAARTLDAGGVPGSSGLASQWDVAARTAVKILVREEGWYGVGRDELVAAGLDPGADPRKLKLFAGGHEVAMLVNGEEDGRLDAEDGIEFYGLGRDIPSTDACVYWLVVGPGRGDRIEGTKGHGKWAPAAATFPLTVEVKDRTTYVPTILDGSADDFFGAVVTSDPVSEIVGTPHLDPTGEVVLSVSLQGATDVPHQVGVELNGVRVATVTWSGMVKGECAVPVRGGVREGDNLVTLTAEAGDADDSLVDVVRVRYAHTWKADSDALRFAIGGYQAVTIQGFASARVRAFDVTDPWSVEDVTGDAPGSGGHAVNVAIRESGTRAVLAVGDGALRHPAAVVVNRPSSLHDEKQGADLVIIAHESMLPALEPLRALRERQGWKVAVVDAEDVYDEFSFGAKGPQAIRDLLARAVKEWKKSPKHLLLAGSASYDPRDYLGLGYGDFDLVPTRFVDTEVLKTASDDWFADFNGDGIATLGVGRLPVATPDEAAAVVAKIVAYESAPASRKALLVADANDDENDFEALSTQVRGALPTSVPVVEVFRGQLGTSGAQSALARELASGVSVVNYIGHGSVDVWHDDLLTADLARSLVNPRLAFWVSMTCLNGYFHDPDQESLAQALMDAPGGAVAVWASSGLTEANDQVGMDGGLLKVLFPASGPVATLGDAVRAAKAAVGNRGVRRTWNLFGDPTTRLK